MSTERQLVSDSSGNREARTSFSKKAGSPVVEAWGEMAQLLIGVGEFSRNIDGDRIKLPSTLRENLGEILEEKWLISPWKKQCLRAIPKRLWADYEAYLGQQGMEQARIIKHIRPSAKTVVLDKHCRWDLNTNLCLEANLTSTCIIRPGIAWLELWDGKKLAEWLRADDFVAGE